MNTYRNMLLAQLPGKISHLTYGLLKVFGEKTGRFSNFQDLDIIIKKQEKKEWIACLTETEGLKNMQRVDKGNVTHLFLYFEDLSFLQIDLLVEFRRKSLIFMDVEKVLEEVTWKPDGWKVCDEVDSFQYLYWFFGLNEASIPARYSKDFERLSIIQKTNLANRLGLPISELEEILFEGTSYLTSSQTYFLKQNSNNHPFHRLKRKAKDSLMLYNQKGHTLSFSGVDGAGKSTIIELSKRLLEKKYRKKLVVLRHRPSLLPILSSFRHGKQGAEERAASRLPRQGNNHSKLLSVLRFGYYYVDYLIGQFFIYCYYNMRGYAVLYDRYYYDFIVDAKRSNLVFSSRWAKRLLAFLIKPELNFLIYAAPDTILERKQELSEQDIIQLTQGYQNLFEELNQKTGKNAFVALNNIDLTSSLRQVEHQFLTQLCYA